MSDVLGNRTRALEAAVAAARSDVAARRTLSKAHARLIELLVAGGEREEAAQAIGKAILLPVDDAADVEALAFCAFNVGDHALARELYAKVTSLAPHDGLAWYNLASAHRNLGELEKAERASEHALELNPNLVQAALLRSQVRTQRTDANHIDDLRARLNGPNNSTAEIFLNYALAKELEDLGEFDAAFAHLVRGARARRRSLDYNVNVDVTKLGRIVTEFSAKRMREAEPLTTPVDSAFIMGLPRSGTTMIERVLGNNPLVRSNGETDNLLHAIMAGTSSDGGDIFQRVVRARPSRVQDAYRRIANTGAGNALVIEKLPLNYLYAGAVRLTMPNARILLVSRAPMDNLFAMFSTLFGTGYPFSYDLDDLGRYFMAYTALCAHWRQLNDGQILELGYEDFVRDPQFNGAAAAAHLGINWESEMTAIERNRTASTTASAVQVRSPIYQTAVGRWRNFARHLESLIRYLEQQGINPHA